MVKLELWVHRNIATPAHNSNLKWNWTGVGTRRESEMDRSYTGRELDRSWYVELKSTLSDHSAAVKGNWARSRSTEPSTFQARAIG